MTNIKMHYFMSFWHAFVLSLHFFLQFSYCFWTVFWFPNDKSRQSLDGITVQNTTFLALNLVIQHGNMT